MSEYDFIVDNIRYSYSSVTTYETCRYGFKLTYIDSVPRIDNYYSDYGKLTHDCLEKYFTYELDAFELSDYYREQYPKVVKGDLPMGDPEKYRLDGQNFFDNFSMDRDLYDVLLTEGKVDFSIDDIMITAKPDLVLREKATGITSMYDFKTAVPFRTDKYTGKETKDTKKINGYYKQMFLYTYALRMHNKMPIDKITLLFTRLNREVTIDWNTIEEMKTIFWLTDTIKQIKEDNQFQYNNSNPFFCNNLCSVRNFCEYR